MRVWSNYSAYNKKKIELMIKCLLIFLLKINKKKRNKLPNTKNVGELCIKKYISL